MQLLLILLTVHAVLPNQTQSTYELFQAVVDKCAESGFDINMQITVMDGI